jgi:hypothetical protein
MMVSGDKGGSVSKERIEMAQPRLPDDSYSTQIYPRHGRDDAAQHSIDATTTSARRFARHGNRTMNVERMLYEHAVTG